MGSNTAWAGVNFTVEYDWVGTDTAGEKHILHKSGANWTYWIVGRNVFKYVDARNIERTMPLGHEGIITHISGEQGTAQVRVVGGRIQFKTVYAGRALVIEISSSGSNLCNATIAFFKVRGHEFSEVHGDRRTSFFANERAENVTCAASETPD
jgi:hypothetical protein